MIKKFFQKFGLFEDIHTKLKRQDELLDQELVIAQKKAELATKQERIEKLLEGTTSTSKLAKVGKAFENMFEMLDDSKEVPPFSINTDALGLEPQSSKRSFIK
jgi:hypothetical protein